ncbi:SpoU rRNA methylase family protein [Thermoflavifilum aggregans]|uniref:SpoU rRNA methylase family protein n=1 Tax=Thermoflavifilum aggregans TaxID=454188 RepID=A0A2M9CWT7_9BACT|nr:RNA methyltransferase [Thermoflavifilum aggregans]MBX6380106.1 RNA methyltransferase [Thermoflavifilum aggregans]PJJ76339.1 SpoU rRNA methylase family protein [Thermoflavifilum aggregans]
MRKLTMAELGRKTVEECRQAEKLPVLAVLDQVRSMHNVGAVFRTADAFQIQALWLCGFTPRPPHRDIHKTALGATETVAWQHHPDTVEAIRQLKQQGYEVWAVEQATHSRYLQDFQPDFSRPIAVVFGNEMHGVQENVLQEVDGCLEIPQFGMKHSLNIAVSVGVVLWDLLVKYIRSPQGRASSFDLQTHRYIEDL